jgi:Restriction endonuclease fold toxin 7
MHARYDNMNLGRFLSTDPVRGNPKSPQSWNMYAYVGNSPINRTDPAGQAAADVAQQADRIIDNLAQMVDQTASGDAVGVLEMALANTLATVAKGTTDLLRVGDATGEAIGEGKSGGDIAAAAVGDTLRAAAIAGMAFPVVSKAAGALAPLAEGAVGPGGAAAVRAGQVGETAVRSAFDIGPKTAIKIAGRTRVPDGLTGTTLSEVKNVRSLSFTKQLRDYAGFAAQTGRRFDLFVRPKTQLSGPLLDAIEAGVINRRYIP